MSDSANKDVFKFMKSHSPEPPPEKEGHVEDFRRTLENQKRREIFKKSAWIFAIAAGVAVSIFLSQYEYKKVDLDELDQAFADSIYIEDDTADESYSYSSWDELGETLNPGSGG